MIRSYRKTVEASGGAGSSTGSEQIPPVNGRVLAVHLDYSASAAATLDVTVKTLSPEQTVLSVANNATDGWYYPRVQAQDTSGVGITYDGTNEVYEPVPVDDHVMLAVAGANDGDSVAVTLLVDEG